MATIHITKFVRRQTPASAFSHWTLSDDDFLTRVHDGLANAKNGYRPGVLLVPVDPAGFYTGLVRLKEGDKLIGEYVARRPGEEPRKSTYALEANKLPAKSVWVILYSHAVLLEGKENETECDYEIVSVNASPEVEDAPIPSGALIANHYGISGGTSTKMDDAAFTAALKTSVEFWKDKVMACPEHLRPKPQMTPRGVEFLNVLVSGWAESGHFRLPGNMSYGELCEWLKSMGADQPPGLKERLEMLEVQLQN